MAEGKERHAFLTAYLVLGITLNSFALLGYLFKSVLNRPDFSGVPAWELIVVPIPPFFYIVCLIAILNWKKWGFYGVIATFILTFVIILTMGIYGSGVMGIYGSGVFWGFVHIALLYGLLQIGGDKKGWTQLE